MEAGRWSDCTMTGRRGRIKDEGNERGGGKESYWAILIFQFSLPASLPPPAVISPPSLFSPSFSYPSIYSDSWLIYDWCCFLLATSTPFSLFLSPPSTSAPASIIRLPLHPSFFPIRPLIRRRANVPNPPTITDISFSTTTSYDPVRTHTSTHDAVIHESINHHLTFETNLILVLIFDHKRKRFSPKLARGWKRNHHFGRFPSFFSSCENIWSLRAENYSSSRVSHKEI